MEAPDLNYRLGNLLTPSIQFDFYFLLSELVPIITLQSNDDFYWDTHEKYLDTILAGKAVLEAISLCVGF